MQNDLKQRVLNAFLLVMRPVVRILLRYGIGYREFAEVTKMAFVDVASSDFGLRGRPTNISRVAVMTGLTRKEVRRLRDQIATGESTISVKTTPFTQVLHHWHSQSEFTDANGKPKRLPFAGDEGSFTSLVKKFGGDIPAGAMRTEMKRVGVLKEDDLGSLMVVDRFFKSESEHETLVSVLVHSVYTLLSNIAHNTDPALKDSVWPHRVAHTQVIKSGDTRQLRRITRDRIVDFAESIDDVFTAYESLQGDESTDNSNVPVAVGVFYFEELDKNADYDW